MRELVLFSGGIDSSTLLYDSVRMFGRENVAAIGFDYGQRHAREFDAARLIAEGIGVSYDVYNIQSIRPLLARGSQTGDELVPEGHYADESMKATIVPNRNMIMLSLAAAAALTRGFTSIAYAAHAGDRAIYPDCRIEFVSLMRELISLCDLYPLELRTPFVEKTKAYIVRTGFDYGVPLALTWSCYKGGSIHCGKCGTCVERIEAFQLAGVEDTTIYE